jgi:hypothetical protein
MLFVTKVFLFFRGRAPVSENSIARGPEYLKLRLCDVSGEHVLLADQVLRKLAHEAWRLSCEEDPNGIARYKAYYSNLEIAANQTRNIISGKPITDRRFGGILDRKVT